MTSTHLNKEQWVSMFRDIGLDDKTMAQWHQAFERRHPEGHQEFLEWLNIPSSDITNIRNM